MTIQIVLFIMFSPFNVSFKKSFWNIYTILFFLLFSICYYDIFDTMLAKHIDHFQNWLKLRLKYTKQSSGYTSCDFYYYGYTLLACLVSILSLIIFTISVLYCGKTHLGGLNILIQCVLKLNRLHVVCRIW